MHVVNEKITPQNNIARRFVISDIHGNYLTLKKLLNKIQLTNNDELYILGDSIDRGLNSAKVLDLFLKLKEEDYKVFILRGNHEEMILRIQNKKNLVFILESLNSTDLLNKKGKIKKKYINLLESTDYYFELDNFFLVHAGLDLEADDIFANKYFMLHSRFIPKNITKLNGKKLIHGHVPTKLKHIKKSIVENHDIICIDNGAVFKDKYKSMGNLICLEINEMKLTVQSNID